LIELLVVIANNCYPGGHAAAALAKAKERASALAA